MAWSAPAPPRGDEIIRADIGEALKKEKPDWKSRFTTPRIVFLSLGFFVFGLLSVVPIWNALCLLKDSNYIFWAGTKSPTYIIVMCVSILLLYALLVSCFFRRQQTMAHIEQTMMMIVHIFITMFGLGLMFLSLPLSHQAELTYSNLMFSCDVAQSSIRLYQYAAVLSTMRSGPDCALKTSVEECDGYEDAPPYTAMLKGMEENYHCAGFCYKPSFAPVVSTLSLKQKIRKRYSNQMLKLGVDANLNASSQSTLPIVAPTLFSHARYHASCDGMAARDMKNFAGTIGQQTFLQGLALVLIAVMTGFLKLFSFCMSPKSAQDGDPADEVPTAQGQPVFMSTPFKPIVL